MSFDRIVLGPREGQGIWQLGNEFSVKATGEQTAGAYTLLEQSCAGAPPPLHVHDDEEEAFYVLDGSLDVHIGDEVVEATAGSFCLVPRGTVHSFRSTSETPARMLVLLSPPGFERFFEEAERRFPRSSGMPDPAEVGPALGEIGARHGLRIVGPPPGSTGGRASG